MKRGGPLRRRTPLRPRSKKAVEVAAKRREMAALVGPLAICEFPGCRRSPDDWHERLPRGQGGSPTDPANRVLLCRPHHDWVELHPKEAHAMGLRRWSWEGP